MTASRRLAAVVGLVLTGVVWTVLLAGNAGAVEPAGEPYTYVAPVVVCGIVTDCAAWDLERGIVTDGRPGDTVAGDDNGDGRIDEDETGWACWADGNRRCSTVPLTGH